MGAKTNMIIHIHGLRMSSDEEDEEDDDTQHWHNVEQPHNSHQASSRRAAAASSSFLTCFGWADAAAVAASAVAAAHDVYNELKMVRVMTLLLRSCGRLIIFTFRPKIFSSYFAFSIFRFVCMHNIKMRKSTISSIARSDREERTEKTCFLHLS